jgi:bifunctional non-homologous end joining protein LigD
MKPLLPMLATPAVPFDSEAYLFEVKWDGVRALAATEAGRWRLWGRTGTDYTARYPELAVLGRLPTGTVVDGELVVLQDGRADFPALLRRHQRQHVNPLGATAFPQRLPVTYVLFDLLFERGRCLVQEALVQRRARLRELLLALDEPVLAYSDGVVGCGREFFARVVAQGHEGVLAKHRASRYRPGQRSAAWRKIKPVGMLPCVIVGYRPNRDGIQRLLLATVSPAERSGRGQKGSGTYGPGS